MGILRLFSKKARLVLLNAHTKNVAKDYDLVGPIV